MTFLVRPGAPPHQDDLQARAFTAWRDAERFVQLRWDDFPTADRSSRRGAFAAYGTALDAEAAAVWGLADAWPDLAEAA